MLSIVFTIYLFSATSNALISNRGRGEFVTRADESSSGLTWLNAPPTSPETAVVSLFAALAEHVFDQVIVLCYRESCNRHYRNGTWPESIRDRISVQDGFEVDEANKVLLDRIGNDHSTKGWHSHMVAVERASRMNANTVLLIEDDVVESDFATAHLGDRASVEKLTRALRAALGRVPWQGLKLASNYQLCTVDTEALPDAVGECRPRSCRCTMADGWRRGLLGGDLALCATGPGTCEFLNSAFYALHRSAYPVFLQALRAARQGREAQNSTLRKHVPHRLLGRR